MILTPTRELTQQVGGVLTEIAKPAGLKVTIIFGGVGYGPQDDGLARGAHIVVGTPGRMLDHMRRRTLRLSSLSVLILDEADQMLDQGFARDVESIIEATPKSRQTALFSATTPTWVQKVAAKYLKQPVIVNVEADAGDEPDIGHTVVGVWNGEKMPVLVSLLSEPTEGATLVFGRTRRGVENMARRLQRLGFEVEALQGDLGQNARDRIVKKFRDGHLPILLATNVAARGLDMLNIERVINYDLPETSDLFVHRVGRTARMGRSGEAITLVSTAELPKLMEIERALGKKLPRVSASEITRNAGPPPQRVEVRVAPPVQQQEAQAAPGTGRRRRRRRPGAPRFAGASS